MTNAIEIQSVTRTFGNSKALDDVNLSVPEDSIWVSSDGTGPARPR